MGSAPAFQRGWDAASERGSNRRERKHLLEDEERQKRVSELYDRGHNLAKVIPSLTGDERDTAMKSLTDIEQGIAQIYHPDHNPGALQKDWHWLSDLVMRKPPPTTVANPSPDPVTTPGATVAGGMQSIKMDALPDYTPQPTGVRDPATNLLHTVAQPTEHGTAESLISLPGGTATTPARKVDVRPAASALTPQQRRIVAQRDEARRQAGLDVAAAGLTPEQEARADSVKTLARLREAQKNFEATHPSASPEQKQQFMSELIEATYGIKERPVWKQYTGPNGEKKWLDASKPELIEPGWNATGTESADTRTRADFDAYRREHPDYKGSLQQWKVEQGQLGKLAVPTNRDDRYIAIEQKQAMGEPLTKDEQAFSDAYDLYIRKRVTGPMLARVAAQAGDRYVQVMDPDNPEQIIFVPAAVASQAKLGSPQSIGFQMDKAMSKYMTVGKGGENINYFNTSVEHLKLLAEAADALQNGDMQKLNQWGNAFATLTGDPAPTNFETVKSAVAGELSKTFAGKSATVEEIAQINQAIYQSESPEQLHGAITMALRLMDGKLRQIKYQYEQGKHGAPAFRPESGDTTTPHTSGGGDDTITMKLSDGRTGKIHRLQKDQFIHDHPGAVEVTQ